MSSTAGRASNRLEATRRDDGTVALDVGLRLEATPTRRWSVAAGRDQ